jgi:hypothetical protein
MKRPKSLEPQPTVTFLTVNQLAVRWQVTPDFLYRDIVNAPDGIPAMKLNRGHRGRWRIRVADVELYETQRSGVCA